MEYITHDFQLRKLRHGVFAAPRMPGCKSRAGLQCVDCVVAIEVLLLHFWAALPQLFGTEHDVGYSVFADEILHEAAINLGTIEPLEQPHPIVPIDHFSPAIWNGFEICQDRCAGS